MAETLLVRRRVAVPAPGTVIGVDPGKHRCGVGLLRAGLLVEAHWIESRHVAAWVLSKQPDLLVLEKPQDYARFAVAHRNLDDLRDVLDDIRRNVRTKIQEFFPAEWKGQLPKEVHHRRIWALLNDEERGVLLDYGRVGEPAYVNGGHNVYDGVGLTLLGGGRCGKGAVRL